MSSPLNWAVNVRQYLNHLCKPDCNALSVVMDVLANPENLLNFNWTVLFLTGSESITLSNQPTIGQ